MDYSPGLVETSWENCAHLRWHRAGYRQGKQLWRCALCHKCQIEGRRYHSRADIIQKLGPLFLAGWKAKHASSVTGIIESTVRRYYRKFMRFRPLHICGKPVLHKGACPK